MNLDSGLLVWATLYDSFYCWPRLNA